MTVVNTLQRERALERSKEEQDRYVQSVLSFSENDLDMLSDTYSFNKHDRSIEHDVIELAKKGAFV